jgi:hypothetical protein
MPGNWIFNSTKHSARSEQNRHTDLLSPDSFVGIFWAVRENRSPVTLLIHRCSLNGAEPYGRVLTCAHGHYEVWEQLRNATRPVQARFASLIATSEYEERPRGRVVYDPGCESFILYADPQILQRPGVVRAIRETFGLPADRTGSKGDAHYRSSRKLGNIYKINPWVL